VNLLKQARQAAHLALVYSRTRDLFTLQYDAQRAGRAATEAARLGFEAYPELRG
jgi:hypothetical protein